MSVVGATGALLDSFLTTRINQMADSSLSCYISVCRRNQRTICARGLQTWSVNQWLNFYSVIGKCQLTHRPLKQANKKKSSPLKHQNSLSNLLWSNASSHIAKSLTTFQKRTYLLTPTFPGSPPVVSNSFTSSPSSMPPSCASPLAADGGGS